MRSTDRRNVSRQALRLIVGGLLLLGLLQAVRWLRSSEPGDLTGPAAVIDGDSLRVGATEIRLAGIDAPEGRQTCLRMGSQPWPCGREARVALERLVANRPVSCRNQGRDQHNRLLAECWVGERSVNAEMVLQGWAVASGRGPTAPYLREQQAASDARVGIWQGTFTHPREWRRQNGLGQ